MSLREQWYNARMQRQQEVLERKQSVAAFLEQTRSQQQQMWLEQAQQRAAYMAALQDYVWGWGGNSDIIGGSIREIQ